MSKDESLFNQMIDKMLNYHSSTKIVAIECGSWTSMYKYIMEENPSPADVTSFSELVASSDRVDCVHDGGGSVKIEIRRDHVCNT